MYIRNSSRLQFQEAIPKIAQILSEKTGVRIRQYGNQAVCKYDENGDNVCEIVVPMIPENASNHLFTMVSGFLDHECGHALYTDGSSYKRLTKKGHKVPFDLVNMIEDARIEKLMAKRYPGCKMNLEYVNENVTKDHVENIMIMTASQKTKKSRGAISALCLHVCMAKAIGHVCFDQIIDFFKKNFNDIYTQINKIVMDEAEALNALKNTDDAVLEAERIYNRVKTEVMDQPELDRHSKGEEGEGEKKVKIAVEVEGDESKDKSGGKSEKIDADITVKMKKPEDKEGEKSEEKEEKSEGGEDKEEGEESEGDQGEGSGFNEAENEQKQDESTDGEAEASSGSSEDGNDKESKNPDDDDSDSLVDVVLKMNEEEFSRTMSSFNREVNVTKIINNLINGNGNSPNTYMPYTTELDYFGPAKFDTPNKEYVDASLSHIEEKTGQYVGTMAKDVERYISAKSLSYRVGGTRRGKLCAANLSRLAVGDDRIFSKRIENRTKDVAVELLVDFSGSMGGRKIYLAMMSAFALADTLGLCGIKTQVRGFTTRSSDSSHEVSELYERVSHDYYCDKFNFSRYEALNCPIVKSFDENMRSSAVRHRFASIFYRLSANLRYAIKDKIGSISHSKNSHLDLQNNIDGECVQFVARELLARPEKGKIMIVVSDGCPCANMSGYLASSHLKKVVEEIEKSEIKIAGIGIMDDAVNQFYTNHSTIFRIEELPKALLEQVKKFI